MKVVMRKIKRVCFLFLALLFIFETWLWDVTGAMIASIVALLPLQRWREHIAARIEHLSPYMTLSVFIIPAIVLFPLKILAVWLMAQGSVMWGISVVMLAKCLGFGVSSFLFHVCKPKLMQLAWLRRVYDVILMLREKAYRLIAPYKRHIHMLKEKLKRKLPRGRGWLRVKRWRNKIRKKQ